MIYSLYASNPKTTIGGAEIIGSKIDAILKNTVQVVYNDNFITNVKSSDTVIVNYFNPDILFKLVHTGCKTILVGHRSYYANWLNIDNRTVYDNLFTIAKLGKYNNFYFICLSETDFNLLSLTNMIDRSHMFRGRHPSIDISEELRTETNKTIGFSGRLSYEKGPTRFLKLNNFLQGYEFRITNVPADDTEYELTLNRGDGIAAFYDPFEYDNFWKNLDCLVITSRYESVSSVLFESLSKGIPVVMFDCVTPDTRYFEDVVKVVPQDDYYIMSKCIRELTSRNPIKLSEKCIEKLTNYYNTVPCYSECIKTILNKD